MTLFYIYELWFAGGVPFFLFQVKKHILDTFLERAEDGSGLPGPTRNAGMGLLPPYNTCWPWGHYRKDCKEGKSWYLWIIPMSVPFTLVILFILNVQNRYWKVLFWFFLLKFCTEGGSGRGREAGGEDIRNFPFMPVWTKSVFSF